MDMIELEKSETYSQKRAMNGTHYNNCVQAILLSPSSSSFR